MALTTETLIAIVGGSIGALVFLLTILAVLMYCLCGKRRRNKEEKRKFHNLSSSNEPSLSKNNNFGNGVMLPKVGSSGLWHGAPSMYSKDPADAYYAEKANRRSSSLQRAPSESRLPPPTGHMVYQGNMHQFYHSQQLPGVYGHPYSNPGMMRGNYYGLHPYNYGNPVRDSRAILVEYPDEEQVYPDYRGRHVEDDHRRNPKVKRTHSDLTGTKRKKHRKRQGESPSVHGSKERSQAPERGQAPTRSQAPEQQRQRTASVEVYERRQSEKKNELIDEQTKSLDFRDQELSSECATDSAKLRAMQQERSRDQDIITNKWKDSEDLKLNLPHSDEEEDKPVRTRSYEYSGKLSSNYDKSNLQQQDSSPLKRIDALSRQSSDGVARALVKDGQTNLAFSHDEIRTSTARKDIATPRTDYPDSHRKAEKSESNADGKQVTAAFEFLNTYMSDDEGTEHFESRNQSPIPF